MGGFVFSVIKLWLKELLGLFPGHIEIELVTNFNQFSIDEGFFI